MLVVMGLHPRKQHEMTKSAFAQQIREQGYVFLRQPSDAEFSELISSLGEVIHVEDICSDGRGDALLSSTDALSAHTDHHAASHIVWRCIEQADGGGESVIVDGVLLFEALPEEYKTALRTVRLAEHNVFDGDCDEYPMVTEDSKGKIHLYYSYWLARDDLVGIAKKAFEAFSRALHVVPEKRFLLRPGDALAIDNHRILHGRTRILGETKRHLFRYWLSPSKYVLKTEENA